jgi:hypothetical protein
MYTYYNDGTSSQWVVANSFTGGSGYLPLTGGTVTGVVNFTAGSAAAPSISISGDPNTGIFFPAADTIAFAEGGTEALRINSNAQVVTTAGTVSLPAITTTGGTNTGIFFPAADSIALVTAGTEDFRIGPAGQFGVQGANYGTSGQVLTSGGASAAPTWSTPSGGVTSLAAGNGITVSGSTGAVTVSQDFYTGTTNNNTSFPIGTILFVRTPTSFLAAASVVVRLKENTSNTGFQEGDTSRTALTGTWRSRGQSDAPACSFYLVCQRTA